MHRDRPRLAGLKRDARGVAVLELALVSPLLITMLLGILAYGGYFWRAHALQQLANDAARAAIAGLTASERTEIAKASVAQDIEAYAGLAAHQAVVATRESGGSVTVELRYDASRDPIFKLGLVPMPDPVIRRTAAVRLGGL